MTISIGTSHAPSAWETHAAWLRLRADDNRLAADVDGQAPVARRDLVDFGETGVPEVHQVARG
ncbi:hypothetical protein [Actinoplanes sp. NPDC026670]|uniref:hypothetical protein n=1 Tax=Actinoplanes sp. NPDC026670 TaxID=3154700 RepID=UPI0033D3B030